MAHKRNVIRDAVVVALTGLVTTGANVTANRAYVQSALALPSLNIISGDEAVTYESGTTPRQQMREHTIEIEARVQAIAGLDTTLDLIASEVEVAMAAEVLTGLGGLVSGIDLISSSMQLGASGDQVVGLLSMIYTLTYYTAEV